MKAATIALISLVFCGAARAGSITVSVVDTVISNFTVAGTGRYDVSANACVGIQINPQTCVYGSQPSDSLTTPLGTAQSSASVSTTSSIVLTTQGSITAAGGPATPETLGESSTYSLSVNAEPPLPNESIYGLYPAVLVSFGPDINQTGTVGFDVRQNFLEIDFVLTGSAPALFSLDPSAGLMTLFAPPGDSGGLLLTGGVIFIFASGVITESNSFLGLAAPPVGSPADFAVNYSPLLSIGPGAGSGNDVSQSADLTTIPEPESFALTLGALVALLCGSSLHRRFRRA